MPNYTHIVYVVIQKPPPYMRSSAPFGRIYGVDAVGGWDYRSMTYRKPPSIVSNDDGPSACQFMIPGVAEEEARENADA